MNSIWKGLLKTNGQNTGSKRETATWRDKAIVIEDFYKHIVFQKIYIASKRGQTVTMIYQN